MKIERGYPIYTVTPKAENAIVKGHPWVYDAEILNTEGETANGGLVDAPRPRNQQVGHVPGSAAVGQIDIHGDTPSRTFSGGIVSTRPG